MAKTPILENIFQTENDILWFCGPTARSSPISKKSNSCVKIYREIDFKLLLLCKIIFVKEVNLISPFFCLFILIFPTDPRGI